MDLFLLVFLRPFSIPQPAELAVNPLEGLLCVHFVLAHKLRTLVELFPFSTIFLRSAAAHSLQSEMLLFWERIPAGDWGAKEPVGLYSSSFSSLHYLCTPARTPGSSLLHEPGLVCTSLILTWALRHTLWLSLENDVACGSLSLTVLDLLCMCGGGSCFFWGGGDVGEVKNCAAAISIFFSYNLWPKYLSCTDCVSWNLGIFLFAVVAYDFFQFLLQIW